MGRSKKYKGLNVKKGKIHIFHKNDHKNIDIIQEMNTSQKYEGKETARIGEK